MPANRSDAARRAESIPNTRRAPHTGLPAQSRRIIPAPDGLSKVGRSATARHTPNRIDATGSGDSLTVPRGFPLGNPDYHAVAGQPGDIEAGSTHDRAAPTPEPAGTSVPPRSPEPRVLRRVGTGRAPFRSAVLGGALLVAVLGAGVAAWAMAGTDNESDQGVVNQVDQSGTNQPGPSTVVLSTPGAVGPAGDSDPTVAPADPAPAELSPADPAPAQADPAPAEADPDSATADVADPDSAEADPDSAGVADPEPPGAADVITDPDVPPAPNLGPATVSAIPPGDPGFGWPSTAFGLPPEPAADQN